MIEPAFSKASAAAAFDFHNLERFSESQLGSLRYLHESFIRGLSSSLSVYLRSYVSGRLIGIEQCKYAELTIDSQSPVCLIYLKIKPYEDYCVLEIRPGLLAPILDLILGGDGKLTTPFAREMTVMEKDLLEGLFGIFTKNLAEAWKAVLPIEFKVEALETRPKVCKRVAGCQPVGVVSMELRIGEVTGALNLAIPSRIVKLLQDDTQRQSGPHHSLSSATEHAIQRRLAKELLVNVDCDLHGSNMRLRDLLELKVGGVVDLGILCDGALTISVNGTPKFKGWLTQAGARMTVSIE